MQLASGIQQVMSIQPHPLQTAAPKRRLSHSLAFRQVFKLGSRMQGDTEFTLSLGEKLLQQLITFNCILFLV